MIVAIQWLDDLSRRFGEEIVTLGLMLAFCLIVVTLLLATMAFLTRRQRRQDLRDVVTAIEELRAGGRGRVELPTRSPLAIVADSVNRLSQDVGLQLGRGERARRRLEALSSALADSGILSTNADWEVETFSEGACRLFGWNEEELRGQSASLLFTEPGWKELLPKMARRSLRRKGLSARTSMVTKAGRVLDAELTLRQLGGGGYVLVLRDVSEQVRVEADLRGAERRYRTLLDNLVQGVFVLQEGRVVYANPACATLVDREADSLASTRLQEWVATEDVILVRETLAAVADGSSESRSVRCTLIDADGRPTAQVRLQARPIEEDGRSAALVAVIDETRVRRAGAVLQRTAARLDAVLEAAEDGILLLVEAETGAPVVEMANTAFGRLTGIESRECLGQNLESLVDRLRDAGGGVDAIGAFLLAGADEDTVEIRSDTPRMLDLHASALADGDGRIWGRVLLVRDVTDRRAVERRLVRDADELRRSKQELEVSYEELRAVNEELGQRSEQVDELNEELRKLDRMKSKMLADVSHELQTPLVSIRGYTEMILKGRLGEITEEQRKGLTLSLGNIDRLIGMIDRLLAYARLEREGDAFEAGDFALAPVVGEAIELLRGQAADADVSLAQTTADPEIAVHGDRDKLLQVFLNLLTNGIKFNRPGGRVEVEVRAVAGRVQVRVADTGVGIPEPERERIFDHFYRAESAEEESGSGIGLSIVKRILERHGSKIELDSQPGRGTIFQFELPQVEVRPESPPPAIDDEPPDPGPSGERPRLRIIRSRRSD